MAELGDLGWWREKRWGRGKAGRRLARTFHASYHALLISQQEHTLWQWTDRDGHLHDTMVSRLEMDLAIIRAKVWCANDFRDKQYGHALAGIATRLPEKWAKNPRRRAFALRAFEELCEGHTSHGKGDLGRLAQKLDRSPDAVAFDREDFFLFAASLALDDDAWAEAMSGRDLETGRQMTEGEELPCGEV